MRLNNKEIIEVLDEYVDNPKKQYAILIDGNWGCGKTHFIKNEYIKDKDTNKLYISLYGIKSKEEINKKIYYTIIDSVIKNNKNKQMLEKAKKTGRSLSNIITPVTLSVKEIFNVDLSKIKDVDISGVISLFKDIKNYILIFDDLERCDMPINEVLGYINEYVEHKNVKVILIANENEINNINYDTNYELKVMSCLNAVLDFGDDNKTSNNHTTGQNGKVTLDKLKNRIELLFEENKKYKAIKEKLIGFTIKYEPDLSTIYDQLVNEYKDKNNSLYEFLLKHKEIFINIMQVNKCKNIRTVVYILDIFEALYNKSKSIINSTRIMDLVYRNTIFCAIGVKYGIKIEKLLDGGMCNVSASLYDDKSYNSKSYFTAFDFVNEFIITGKLDESKIAQSVNYYKELQFDDLEAEDPFYKLQNYWVLDNKNIKNALDQINENIKRGIYNYRLFPKILYYLSRIENLKFEVELINEIIEAMKNNLEETKIEYIDFHAFVENENVAMIYNKHVEEIKEKIDATNVIENKKTIKKVFESKNWGIELYEFVKNNRQKYLNKKGFMKELDVETIINKIKESDSNNIYYFKYSLDEIYNFSNLSEYYSEDKENIEKLIKALAEMDKTSFGVTKIEIIEYMNSVLREIQTKL